MPADLSGYWFPQEFHPILAQVNSLVGSPPVDGSHRCLISLIAAATEIYISRTFTIGSNSVLTPLVARIGRSKRAYVGSISATPPIRSTPIGVSQLQRKIFGGS